MHSVRWRHRWVRKFSLLFVHLHAWNYQIVLVGKFNRYCYSLRYKYEQAFKGKLFSSFPLLCVFVVHSRTTHDEQFKRFSYEKPCASHHEVYFKVRSWMKVASHFSRTIIFFELHNFSFKAEKISLVIPVSGSLRRVFEDRCQFSSPAAPTPRTNFVIDPIRQRLSGKAETNKKSADDREKKCIQRYFIA